MSAAPPFSPLQEAKARIDVFALGVRLFPGWKSGRSCHSPFREDRHPSFSIFADGCKWMDHATGEHGDVVDFLALARGIGKAAAARELIALAGIGSKARALPARTPSMPPRSAPVERMPAECRTIWREGLDHLLGSEPLQRRIETWRSWPAGIVHALAESGLLGCPIHRGERGTAFVSQLPFRDELGFISTVDCGFHFRQKSRADVRPVWLHVPNGKPALPFVLGGGFIGFARTILVCEGEWDAVTLAAAAGWLASDAAWPEDLTVFALPGASAWAPLLCAWAPFWPRTARFVLFPDADEAGEGWLKPDGFKDQLVRRGHAVRVCRTNIPGTKDVSDLHRLSPITPEKLSAWIFAQQVHA